MDKKTGVKNKRLLFAKNSIMMFVMLVVIFLAIFAWYNNQNTVTATGITVSASDPEQVKIAVTQNGEDDGLFGSWIENTTTHELEWNAGVWSNTATFKVKYPFSTDVTSDGANFLVPGFSSTENNSDAKDDARTNGKIVNTNAIPTQAINNLTITQAQINEGKTPDYYSIPFYLCSKSPDLCVEPSAYLAMAAEKDGAALTGANSVRKSAYGNFTSDALVAAMRVSIVGAPVSSISNNTAVMPNNVEYQSSFVWLPRPDLFLTIPAGASEDDWTLRTGITKTTNNLQRIGNTLSAGTTFRHNYYTYRYVDPEAQNPIINGVTYVADPSIDNTYTTSSLVEGQTVTTEHASNAYKSDTSRTTKVHDNPNVFVPTLGESKEITANMNATPDGSGNYYYKFYLNLWIEGTDTEARRAMDAGEFSLFIEFGNSDE